MSHFRASFNGFVTNFLHVEGACPAKFGCLGLKLLSTIAVCGVELLGSLFDVPTGLLFVLSLVTTNPNDVATAATGLAAPKSSTTIDLNKAPCRHGKQAWYAALSQGAGGVAFSGLAKRIFRTSGGRFYVPVERDRREILKLQRDNAVSCFIALSSAAANAQQLKSKVGRDASLSDLYLAHVFGADRAIQIINAIDATPRKRMATRFPRLDLIVPDLYRGRDQRMTLASFSKRLEQAIENRVAGTNRTAQRKVRTKKRATSKPSRAASRNKLPIHTAHVSARAVNQRRIPKVTILNATVPTSKHLRRFGFAAGLKGALPRAKTPKVVNWVEF